MGLLVMAWTTGTDVFMRSNRGTRIAPNHVSLLRNDSCTLNPDPRKLGSVIYLLGRVIVDLL